MTTCHRCLSSTFPSVGKDACAFCFGRTVYHRQFGHDHVTVILDDAVEARAPDYWKPAETDADPRLDGM